MTSKLRMIFELRMLETLIIIVKTGIMGKLRISETQNGKVCYKLRETKLSHQQCIPHFAQKVTHMLHVPLAKYKAEKWLPCKIVSCWRPVSDNEGLCPLLVPASEGGSRRKHNALLIINQELSGPKSKTNQHGHECLSTVSILWTAFWLIAHWNSKLN